MVTEKLTPNGLVVGLILDESEAPSEAEAVKEENADSAGATPAKKKSTKRVNK